jgi:hypothetical protein
LRHVRNVNEGMQMRVKASRTVPAVLVAAGVLFAGVSATSGSQSAAKPARASATWPILPRGGSASYESSVGAASYPAGKGVILQGHGMPPILRKG